MPEPNYDVLSQRYATKPINDIFSEKGRVIADRNLWLAVMKAQKQLGINIPSEDISKFERARDNVNLNLINEIERQTRHDVKAKIQAYIQTAGAGESIHLGMTSRDLTDNVEQMQLRGASNIIYGKYISVLRHLVDASQEYRDVVIAGRTHHQAAQPTLLGKRFSMWSEELLHNLNSFNYFLKNYPLRGIKGPVGTQSDMLKLLGSQRKVDKLERMVAQELGFSKVLDSTGQVYPRSFDSKLASELLQLSSSPGNFAKTMRLMAGYELMTEGFKEGQVGSSAMPHKMNTRSSERINGFINILKGYHTMLTGLIGDQWEEADVSCSVPRRVSIPGLFYASDGLIETTLTILNEMGSYPVIISRELDTYLPFLASTQFMNLAVNKRIGREEAHKAIKKVLVAEALARRREGVMDNLVSTSLANHETFKNAGITKEDFDRALSNRKSFIGRARSQIDKTAAKANRLILRYPDQAAYEPGEIL